MMRIPRPEDDRLAIAFPVPRRSGIALSAAAGVAVSVASTTIKISFNMAESSQALTASLFPCVSQQAECSSAFLLLWIRSSVATRAAVDGKSRPGVDSVRSGRLDSRIRHLTARLKMTENRVLLEEPQDFRRKDDGLIEITSTGVDRISRRGLWARMLRL